MMMMWHRSREAHSQAGFAVCHANSGYKCRGILAQLNCNEADKPRPQTQAVSHPPTHTQQSRSLL